MFLREPAQSRRIAEVNMFGYIDIWVESRESPMVGLPTPFGGGSDDDSLFNPYDAFVPAHLPDPGPFLAGHDLLSGTEHTAFHRVARAIFEDRGVYDMTFGYNLARLNLDTRHTEAGYRYAIERGSDDGLVEGGDTVLRAEFTPTTAFCPQSDTLTKGSFRAWNGDRERHEFDLVRVRVAENHQRSDEINAALEALESEFVRTGTLPDDPGEKAFTPAEDPEGYGEEEGFAGDAPF